MGDGLLEAVRHRLRRLPDARAHPEGQLPLVPRTDSQRQPGAGRLMPRVGLQLYTVRDECARDLPATLRTVADVGYDGVELFDLHGDEAAALRSPLDGPGLGVAGRAL